VVIEPFITRPKELKVENPEEGFASHSFLLGVDWAHLKTNEEVRDRVGVPIQEKYHVRMNTAMMCVVPAWKIQEILDLDEQIEMRKIQDDKLTKKLAESPVELDQAKKRR
jgi:hypothetical protein